MYFILYEKNFKKKFKKKKQNKKPPKTQQNQNLKNKTIFTILCACKGITDLCF